MEDKEECPHCGVSLRGEPIPAKSRKHYGEQTHYSRTIGMEVMGVYDGVLYWQCPDCGGTWHRWPEKFSDLRRRAEEYIHGRATYDDRR